MKFTTTVVFEVTNSNIFDYETITENIFLKMVSLFLFQGYNVSCIVDLFAALYELTSARAVTLLSLASYNNNNTLLKNRQLQGVYIPTRK